MPTTETGRATPRTQAERFAEYIRPAVVAAGFDIDSPRGGGKKELARLTGASQSSIGRMLAGQTMPGPVLLEKLAEVLGLPLTEVLVRSGMVSNRMSMARTDRAESPPSLSVEDAARRLGIRSAKGVNIFKAMVESLRAEEEGN
ncbi:helix-turn-helix transcriptional regulator [Streptomyces sp. ND04-05B]|uniref:helix-turn-helix domain-containing protein n=1 Tax=Streptomyces sp. ND04-05B TaxID=3028693 RepID=UPI0029BBD861|nr:helix-turn-helix transcriptional regulator [Streptomyces sp. ND04-05B]MDX3068162.1 helix-turn-helix transcriptional regulator [Streptomyces sp. ND04-05B]